MNPSKSRAQFREDFATQKSKSKKEVLFTTIATADEGSRNAEPQVLVSEVEEARGSRQVSAIRREVLQQKANSREAPEAATPIEPPPPPTLEEVAAAVELTDALQFLTKKQEEDRTQSKSKRRRYVMGLRECTRPAVAEQLFCVVLANNLQSGTESHVAALREELAQKRVHLIELLNRKKLGRACGLTIKVSCVGILESQSTRFAMATVMERHATAKEHCPACACTKVALFVSEE